MSDDFKPATRPLLRLAGLDGERPFVSRADENDALWTAVLALMLRLYLQPDAEARRADGPPDAQVLGALRAALAENFGIEAADYLAWALVHYGCRQRPTLASLPPWEALMFDWQERHATAPRIALLLQAAGLGELLVPETLESLDGWITQPATVLGEGARLPARLFGERLVTWSLDGADPPAHDALFTALVRSVAGGPGIALVRQWRVTPGGPRWAIACEQQGREVTFEAQAADGRLDVDAVMRAVDAVFERAGRPERVFRLLPGRTAADAPATFVVADALRFGELCLRLRIPLLRDPSGAAGVVARGPMPVGALAAGTAAPGAARGDASAAGGTAAAPAVAEVAEDAEMKSLLAAQRRSFGAGRLLQAGRWVRQSHVEPPSWILAQADPVGLVYERMEPLLRKGRIVWGAPVLVDVALRRPGDSDLPLVLLTSDDPYYDARPMALAAIAARLATLRRTPPEAPEWRAVADQVRNDSGRPLGVSLPPAPGGHDLLLTSAMGVRAHLPGGMVTSAWLPLLVSGAASEGLPMLLPIAYWSSGMRAALEAGRLGWLV